MSLLFGIYLNITPFYYVGYFLFYIYTAYSLYPFYSSVAQCTFFLHLFIVAYKSCGWLFEASRFFRFPFDFHIYFFFLDLTRVRLCGKLLEIIMLDIGGARIRWKDAMLSGLSVCTY